MIARRTRGRPPTTSGLLEEARVQAISLRHELSRHDTWELAALDALDALLAAGDVVGARRIASKLIERDRWENARHAEIDDVWRGVEEVAG
jgi:hypothetical protein